jgi:hypothetical protein
MEAADRSIAEAAAGAGPAPGAAGAAEPLRVDVGAPSLPETTPVRRTIGNALGMPGYPDTPIECKITSRAPAAPAALPVGVFGGQRGGGVRQEDEPLVERSVTEGETAWDGLRTALNRMAPTDPARVLEIKNEILRRLVNEDIDARTGPDGQSVLAKYIQALDITPEIINFRAEGGTTVLMHAAVNGRWKSIQILASPQLRTDPNIQNNAGETALMWAAAYNEMSAIRELKKFRNDQNDPRRPIALNYNVVDNLGWNALMVAAWCGHEIIVQQLAEYTDINHVASDGRNAAKLAMDPVSPARIRGVSNKVIEMLGRRGHPQRGGRNRTPRRSKTNSKKRGTR